MIYLFLNKLRERVYLIQAEIALKYGLIYIFKDEFKYVSGLKRWLCGLLSHWTVVPVWGSQLVWVTSPIPREVISQVRHH